MFSVIACDPGKHGAAVLYDGSIFIVEQFHKNETGEVLNYLIRDSVKLIVIEKVNAFAMQGRVSCFTFGKELGKIEGAIQCKGRFKDVIYVPPQVWQKHFNLITKRKKGLSPHEKYLAKKEHKLKLLKKAKQFYPQADLDTADAILIARYAFEINNKDV